MSNTAKSFDILATNLSVLHNYFDSPNKIIFRSIWKNDFAEDLKFCWIQI